MKFNNLFQSKRNIFFTVIIFLALFLAGGLWQYKNFAEERKMQAQLNEEMKQYYQEANTEAGIQILDENANEDGNDEIKEVSNTSGSKTISSSTAKSPVNSKDQNKKDVKEKAISAIKMQDPKLETMIIPVFGTVNKDYANNELIYSETLDEWTTHLGIDIKTEEGSPVRAAMDGVVYELKNDPQLGLMITIDHGNGVFTKYCNLSTLDMVTKGKQVKKGDVISGVGKTALYEVVEDPHLHFEVIKNDKSIDPRAYLPKQSIKR